MTQSARVMMTMRRDEWRFNKPAAIFLQVLSECTESLLSSSLFNNNLPFDSDCLQQYT